MKKIFLLVILLFLLCRSTVYASENKVFINEFLPDATGADAGKEWIELYNNTSTSIDISGWTISTKSLGSGLVRKTTLPVSSIVQANSYLLIIESETIYDTENKIVVGEGKLNMYNTNAEISLSDSNNSLIDLLTYTTSLEGKSWERKGPVDSPECSILEFNDNGNTISFENSNYTDSCWIVTPSGNEEEDPNPPVSFPIEEGPTITDQDPETEPDPNPASYPESYPTQEEPISFPEDQPASYPVIPEDGISPTIVISELFPSPDTSKGESEWIELFNYGDKSVNLKDYYFMEKGNNTDGYSGTKSFLEEIMLLPQSYYIEKTLKISLNNAGDVITLFDNKSNLIDKVCYPSAKKSKSFGRDLGDPDYILQNDLVELDNPTPGSMNVTVQIEDFEVATTNKATTKKTTSTQTTKTSGTPLIQKEVLGESANFKFTMPKVFISKSNKTYSTLFLPIIFSTISLFIITLIIHEIYNVLRSWFQEEKIVRNL